VTFIRVKINWTGFVGSPGYTNFNFELINPGAWTQPDVDAAVTKVQTWLTVIRLLQPAVVISGIDPAVSEHDEQSGDIVNFWNATPGAAAAGSNPGAAFTSGTGFCINWQTGGVRNGRRVRGRTFVVPISGSLYESNGSFINAEVASWRASAITLAGDTNGVRLGIFAHTPKALIPDGGIYDVTGVSINDRPAFLSSRRG
jgi:hypothetical protein